MLDKRVYSRQELIERYKTNRLDAIKNKILRDGYKYIESGRGKDYMMEIVSLPVGDNEFKRYCVDILQFQPQTDFNKLRYFLYNFLFNDDFVKLQYNEMREELIKQNVEISIQTISKYYEHLKHIGWIWEDNTDYIYYVYDTELKHNVYITKEEYCQMYKTFWQTVRKDCGVFLNAERDIRKKYGGKPRKRPLCCGNGFYSSQYDAIKEILEKEFI